MSVHGWRTIPSTRCYSNFLGESSRQPGVTKQASARPASSSSYNRTGGRSTSARPTSGSSRIDSAASSHKAMGATGGSPLPESSSTRRNTWKRPTHVSNIRDYHHTVSSIPFNCMPRCTRPPVRLKVPWNRFFVMDTGIKYCGLTPFTSTLTATTFLTTEVYKQHAARMGVRGNEVRLRPHHEFYQTPVENSTRFQINVPKKSKPSQPQKRQPETQQRQLEMQPQSEMKLKSEQAVAPNIQYDSLLTPASEMKLKSEETLPPNIQSDSFLKPASEMKLKSEQTLPPNIQSDSLLKPASEMKLKSEQTLEPTKQSEQILVPTMQSESELEPTKLKSEQAQKSKIPSESET